MGDFNYVDICWKSKSAKSQRSIRFSFVGNFTCQKMEDRTRKSATMNLILSSTKELFEGVTAAVILKKVILVSLKL